MKNFETLETQQELELFLKSAFPQSYLHFNDNNKAAILSPCTSEYDERYAIKFLVKLEKTVSEWLGMTHRPRLNKTSKAVKKNNKVVADSIYLHKGLL